MPTAQNKKLTRNIYVFVFCLILSLTLWFLTTMNRMHTDTVKIPVRYINLPENKMVLNDLPDHITVSIKAKGFRLLSNYIFKHWNSLEVNVDSQKDVLKGKTNYWVLPLQNKREEFSRQFGSDITIQNIEPDSIYFQFDSKSSKKVPVIFCGQINFQKNYGQSSSILIQPDSILISGNADLLKTTDSVITEQLITDVLSQDFQNKVKLKTIKGLKYSQQEVSIYIPVEQLTEKKLEIPVNISGVPQDETMKIIPDKVRVNILVPVSKYALVKEDLIQITAEYPQKKSAIQKVILKITRKPDFVKIQSIDPLAVEYIVLKNE